MSTPTIHTTLAQSYLAYFVVSIIGLFADTLIGVNITIGFASQIAIICFGLGALLIGWAQYTSRHLATNTDPAGATDPYFFRGPYRYMRNPTHLGMVLLVTGYTVVSGSLIFCALTIIGYLVSNIFFHKYEALLRRTYDGTYEAYQAKVPKIL